MQKLIHVRFSPDGSVTEIGARPEGVPAQKWFDHLSLKAATAYQTLAGGRGVFRLEAQDLEGISASLGQ